MNQPEDESIRVGRVLKIFAKRGAPGEFTKPFHDFQKDEQQLLRDAAKLEEGEVPILASYRGRLSWVLLTTRRLVWREGEQVSSTCWESITDATIPDSALFTFKATVKQQNAALEVETDQGVLQIVIEPGGPFFGFWNVLKSLRRIR